MMTLAAISCSIYKIQIRLHTIIDSDCTGCSQCNACLFCEGYFRRHADAHKNQVGFDVTLIGAYLDLTTLGLFHEPHIGVSHQNNPIVFQLLSNLLPILFSNSLHRIFASIYQCGLQAEPPESFAHFKGYESCPYNGSPSCFVFHYVILDTQRVRDIAQTENILIALSGDSREARLRASGKDKIVKCQFFPAGKKNCLSLRINRVYTRTESYLDIRPGKILRRSGY
jgi:hypothetical protein